MSYPSTILAESSLVGYWQFGEASGTTAADSKGTNDLTLTNVTLGASGVNATMGTAAQMTISPRASARKAGVAGSGALMSTAWSVEFLAYLTAFNTTDFITSVYSITNGTLALRDVSIASNGKIIVSHATNSSNTQVSFTSARAFGFNGWAHIVAGYDGTKFFVHFINDVQGTTEQSTAMAAPYNGGAGTFDIGSGFWMGSATRSLPGKLQHLAAYNSALSFTQATAHYAEISGGKAGADTVTATDVATVAKDSNIGSDTVTATDKAVVTYPVQGAPIGYKTWQNYPNITTERVTYSGTNGDGSINIPVGWESSVIWDGTKFNMWFHGDNDSGGGTFGGNTAIRYATSTDAETWVDHGVVLKAGTGSTNIALGNQVVFHDGIYHMLVGLAPAGVSYSHDYYTSSDGYNWTLKKANVLGPGQPDSNFQYTDAPANGGVWDTFANSWDGGGTWNLDMEWDGSQWWVFYDASDYNLSYGGTPGPDTFWTWRIGLATGPDLEHLTKYSGNPVVNVGNSGPPNQINPATGGAYRPMVGGANVMRADGRWYMFTHTTDYTTLTAPTSNALFESDDGYNWRRVGWVNRLFNITVNDFPQLADPEIVYDGVNTHMFWEEGPNQVVSQNLAHLKFAGNISEFIQQIKLSPFHPFNPPTGSLIGSTYCVTIPIKRNFDPRPVKVDGTTATEVFSQAAVTPGKFYDDGTNIIVGTGDTTTPKMYNHVTLTGQSVFDKTTSDSVSATDAASVYKQLISTAVSFDGLSGFAGAGGVKISGPSGTSFAGLAGFAGAGGLKMGATPATLSGATDWAVVAGNQIIAANVTFAAASNLAQNLPGALAMRASSASFSALSDLVATFGNLLVSPSLGLSAATSFSGSGRLSIKSPAIGFSALGSFKTLGYVHLPPPLGGVVIEQRADGLVFVTSASGEIIAVTFSGS